MPQDYSKIDYNHFKGINKDYFLPTIQFSYKRHKKLQGIVKVICKLLIVLNQKLLISWDLLCFPV